MVLSSLASGRFLQICRIEKGPSLAGSEVLIYFLNYGLCYLLYASGLKVSTIVEINGSVIGFLYIFFIPVLVHVKCRYFSQHDEQGYMLAREEGQGGRLVRSKCGCRIDEASRLQRYLELAFQALMLCVGLLVVGFTLH